MEPGYVSACFSAHSQTESVLLSGRGLSGCASGKKMVLGQAQAGDIFLDIDFYTSDGRRYCLY